MYLRDTLSGQLKEFNSEDNKVKLYVCGITPYSTAHVGHARSTITFDVLRDILNSKGLKYNTSKISPTLMTKLLSKLEKSRFPIRNSPRATYKNTLGTWND